MANFISNIGSRFPTCLLPGGISGGIFGREIFINNLSSDTKSSDSYWKTGTKTLFNTAIRASSVAFSPYNILSLPYFTAVINPVLAVYKGCKAGALYTQGCRQDNPEKIRQAKTKIIEMAAHVAVFAVDYWIILGLVNKPLFNLAGVVYTIAGAVMDISGSSKKVHDSLFPSKQEILDRKRLKYEDFSSDYDESSVDDDDDDDSNSDYDSSYNDDSNSYCNFSYDDYLINNHDSNNSSDELSFSDDDRDNIINNNYLDNYENDSSDDRRDTLLNKTIVRKRVVFGGPGSRYEKEEKEIERQKNDMWGINKKRLSTSPYANYSSKPKNNSSNENTKRASTRKKRPPIPFTPSNYGRNNR